MLICCTEAKRFSLTPICAFNSTSHSRKYSVYSYSLLICSLNSKLSWSYSDVTTVIAGDYKKLILWVAGAVCFFARTRHIADLSRWQVVKIYTKSNSEKNVYAEFLASRIAVGNLFFYFYLWIFFAHCRRDLLPSVQHLQTRPGCPLLLEVLCSHHDRFENRVLTIEVRRASSALQAPRSMPMERKPRYSYPS